MNAGPEMNAYASNEPELPAPLPLRKRLARIAAKVTAIGAVAFAAFVPAGIAGMQMSLGVVLVGIVGLAAAGTRPWQRGPYDGALVLHLATIGLSLALTAVVGATDPERFNGWRLIAIPLLGWALARDRDVARRAFWALLLTALVISPYAVYQHFTGVDWMRSGERAIRHVAHFASGRFRPIGTFNAYPSFAFVFSVALGFAAAAGLEWVRSLRGRLLLAAAATPALLAVAFTQVRAAWAGLLAGLLLLAALRSGRALLATTAGMALLGALLMAVSPGIRGKAMSTFDLDYSHNSDRVFMWARALEMVGDAPVTGIGHGTWGKASRWYFDRWQPWFPVRCHAHNNFLHFWATTGPLGLAGFLWIFVSFYGAAVPAWRRARGRDPMAAAFAAGAIVAVTAFLVYALAQDPYFDGEVFYVTALALALGAVAASWMGTWRPPRLSVGRLAAGVAPVLGGLAVGLALQSAGRGAAVPQLSGLLGGAAALLSMGIGLGALARAPDRRPLLRDPLTISLVLSALVIAGLQLGIGRVLAPASGIEHHVGGAGLRVGVAVLAATAGLRLWFLAGGALPPRLAAVAGASLLLLSLGTGLGRRLPEGEAPPPPGAAGVVPVSQLDADDPRLAWARAAVTWRPGGGQSCAGVVVSPVGVVVPAACAGAGPGELDAGGEPVGCRMAVVDGSLATLRCQALPEDRHLIDLVGGRLGLHRRAPATGAPVWRLTRDAVTACAVTQVEPQGPLRHDCGPGPHGSPLVNAQGRVVGLQDGPDSAHGVWVVMERIDPDGDGVPAAADGCTLSDPGQRDLDRDGVGDACEPPLDPAPVPDGFWTATASGDVVRLPAEPDRAWRVDARARLPLPEYMKWGAVTAGPFLDPARSDVAVASTWDGDLRIVAADGRILAHHPDVRQGWRDLAPVRIEGPERKVALAAALTGEEGALRLYVAGGTTLELLAEHAGGSWDALAAVDLDGDGLDELVAAGRDDAGAFLQTFRLPDAGARFEPVARTPLSRPAVDLDVLRGGAAPGSALLVTAPDGHLERRHLGASGPAARPDGCLKLAGGARWSVVVAGDGPARLAVFRDDDPVLLPLDPAALEGGGCEEGTP